MRILEGKAELKSKIKEIRSEKKFGEHCFLCDFKEIFEPVTKTFNGKTEEVLTESKTTTAAIGKNFNYIPGTRNALANTQMFSTSNWTEETKFRTKYKIYVE